MGYKRSRKYGIAEKRDEKEEFHEHLSWMLVDGHFGGLEDVERSSFRSG